MTAARPVIVALHCSGSTGRQWSGLIERLGGSHDVHAPDLFGTASRGPWLGAREFSLADEAEPILALIDRAEAPAYLVGHSYGGGLALHVALSRPDRVAGLALYEPSSFHLLKGMGGEGIAALSEITELVRAVDDGVLSGAYREAAARFVDYWGGSGAWAAMPPRLQAALVRYLPKACLDFRALIGAPGTLEDLRQLMCPCLIVRGEQAPRPTQLMAEVLADHLPGATTALIRGAGHMGPLTHCSVVSGAIAEFITISKRVTARPAALAA
ncbi:MAG TPA: alpha/beta hydrolase [Afifellaceae bacterium]|nr:alpha/beta hydrolase [Afifellaceae bacterium]